MYHFKTDVFGLEVDVEAKYYSKDTTVGIMEGYWEINSVSHKGDEMELPDEIYDALELEVEDKIKEDAEEDFWEDYRETIY